MAEDLTCFRMSVVALNEDGDVLISLFGEPPEERIGTFKGSRVAARELLKSLGSALKVDKPESTGDA